MIINGVGLSAHGLRIGILEGDLNHHEPSLLIQKGPIAPGHAATIAPDDLTLIVQPVGHGVAGIGNGQFGEYPLLIEKTMMVTAGLKLSAHDLAARVDGVSMGGPSVGEGGLQQGILAVSTAKKAMSTASIVYVPADDVAVRVDGPREGGLRSGELNCAQPAAAIKKAFHISLGRQSRPHDVPLIIDGFRPVLAGGGEGNRREGIRTSLTGRSESKQDTEDKEQDEQTGRHEVPPMVALNGIILPTSRHVCVVGMKQSAHCRSRIFDITRKVGSADTRSASCTSS
jgi:hypothetical protein